MNNQVKKYQKTLNIQKANNVLKYIPNQTTEEAIEEFLKWYKTIEEN